MPERAKGSDVAEPSGKHVRVAMVDDHPAFRLGLSRLLERNADFEVVWSAASVQQALRNFERSPVDLVIMDLQFGDGVNGLPTSRRSQLRVPPAWREPCRRSCHSATCIRRSGRRPHAARCARSKAPARPRSPQPESYRASAFPSSPGASSRCSTRYGAA
ncbi:MAG: response regulator transcription factor [Chloroflexi bacterium]|nr:MAG: response regulator transcription factor [Chloroflexota bacterium]